MQTPSSPSELVSECTTEPSTPPHQGIPSLLNPPEPSRRPPSVRQWLLKPQQDSLELSNYFLGLPAAEALPTKMRPGTLSGQSQRLECARLKDGKSAMDSRSRFELCGKHKSLSLPNLLTDYISETALPIRLEQVRWRDANLDFDGQSKRQKVTGDEAWPGSTRPSCHCKPLDHRMHRRLINTDKSSTETQPSLQILQPPRKIRCKSAE